MAIVETDVLFNTLDLEGLRPSPLHLTEIDGTTMLIAGGQFQQTAIARIAPQANGAMDVLEVSGRFPDQLNGRNVTATGFETVEIGGTTFLYVSAVWSGATTGRGYLVYEIGADGSLSEIQALEVDGISTVHDHPQHLRAGGESYLVHHKRGIGDEAAISLRIGNDGRLTPVEEFQITTFREQSDVAEFGRKGYMIVEGTLAGVGGGTVVTPITNLQVLEMRANGTFRTAFEVPGDDPGLDNKLIGEIHVAKVGNKTFVFVGENTGGSIAVYRMRADGSLELVELESPDTGDGWRFSNGLKLFEEDGRTFLAAARNELAIFEVNRFGALTELEDAPFLNGESGVFDIEAADIGGQQYLWATTQTDPGMHAFRFTPEDVLIRGNAGNNRLDGTEGDDQIQGRAGRDAIFAGAGNDLAEGGTDADRISGEAGNDNLFGNQRSDRIYGGDGNDWGWGFTGFDQIYGGTGNDFLHGESGNDILFGDEGNDRLFGGTFDDVLVGGLGFDTLTDGSGEDILRGNGPASDPGAALADVFVLVRDGDTDRILDFDDGLDLIDVSAWRDGIAFFDLTIRDAGGLVEVSLGAERLLVSNTAGDLVATDLSLQDFILF